MRPINDERQYIGNVSGETRLFNSADLSNFDNVYGLVEDVNGLPVLAQILLSTPEAIKTAIEAMLRNENPYIKIESVSKLDDTYR